MSSYAETLPRLAPQPITVPVFDASGREASRHVGVALRALDGTIGAPVAVVGRGFAVPSLQSVGAALDTATSAIGGFARLGPARVRVGRGSLSVIAGRDAASRDVVETALVRGDPSARNVFVRLESAFDGSAAESLDLLTVRVLCKNGLVGFGSIGGMTRRHTRGLDSGRAEWAAGARLALPKALADMDALYRRLREDVRIARPMLALAIGEILGLPDAPTAYQSAQASRVINLVASADGTYVPAGIHGSGIVDGLQILEAATAYDRHYARGKEVQRTDRVLAGRGIGSRALSWGVRQVAALDGKAGAQ